jgi:hypothetical protein
MNCRGRGRAPFPGNGGWRTLCGLSLSGWPTLCAVCTSAPSRRTSEINGWVRSSLFASFFNVALAFMPASSIWNWSYQYPVPPCFCVRDLGKGVSGQPSAVSGQPTSDGEERGKRKANAETPRTQRFAERMGRGRNLEFRGEVPKWERGRGGGTERGGNWAANG